MSTLLETIRVLAPMLFIALCVFSYFSGELFARVVASIRRTSWEHAPLERRLAYWLLRAFREYVTASPIADDFIPGASRV